MNDAKLLAELNADPQTLGYDAAGWSDSLPVLTGDPSADPRVPYTAADNIARGVQAEKYQALAALLNDATARPRTPNKLTDKEIFDALDRTEWLAIGANTRQFIKDLREAGNPRWRQVLQGELPPAGATRAALAALRESRHVELSLGGRRGHVTAGDIKRVKGDRT
jgi:hypothetical protein